MFNFFNYILWKFKLWRLDYVIGAGLGIGKLVVQQWTLCSSTKLQEKNQTAMLISCIIEGIGFAALFA
jgi:hypothetical protein